MSAIKPNKAQFMELAQAPDEGPVVMLNLLKFKARADGADSSGAGSDSFECPKVLFTLHAFHVLKQKRPPVREAFLFGGE